MIVSSVSYSLEIVVNYGKENSRDFAVLNIKNDKPFSCLENFNHQGDVTAVECVIDAIPQEGFTPTKTMFFNFYYQMIDGKFHLYIKPNKKQKLFFIPPNLKKNNTLIIKEKPSTSKSWQIIGYEEQIPFLSNQTPIGINFPISIEDAQTPYMPELDIDNKPLKYLKGLDFEAYMSAKALIQKKDYYKAINTINDTLKKYPNTLFKKDFYLYQMIALSHLDPDQNHQDAIITIALNWIKQYSNDAAMPQVLYLLANAYSNIRYHTESQHYYKRIIQEYFQSRYAPLAKMQLAIDLANTNVNLASIYFQKAYGEAKDLASASEIALYWAEFEIQRQNFNNAIILINKIQQGYPQFFLQDPKKTYKTIEFLAKNKLYKNAAQIGQYLSEHTKNQEIQEQISYDLGKLYEKADDFDNAHQANLEYIKKYPESRQIKAVKKRDDSILFEVSGNNEEKLKRYDYIIKKYPHTQQSQKAIELKAQLFIEEKQYKQVLDMRKELGEKSPLLEEAINKLIKIYLQNNDCKNANIYLLQTSNYHLDENEKLKAFDCLYQASLNKNAQVISAGQAQNAKSIEQKLAWLYRDAKNLYQLGEYKPSLMAAKDAFSLALSSKNSQYNDIGFILFFDLAKIGNQNEAFEVYAKLEKLFSNDSRMIEVYAKLLEWQLQNKNETTIQIYAKNIIRLQEKYKIDTFTPSVAFELINSLVRTHKLQDALTQIDILLQKNLDNEAKQKAFYTKGSIENLQNNPNEAKISFEKCLNIHEESPWKNLCSQGLELLNNKN
ncbi:hypothetical protein BKH45_04380 [Helicobacter sp. 11S03491-1]|nr:hypothetical protein BKH45_04380 [Helicobacter sp. 11S03491-1]